MLLSRMEVQAATGRGQDVVLLQGKGGLTGQEGRACGQGVGWGAGAGRGWRERGLGSTGELRAGTGGSDGHGGRGGHTGWQSPGPGRGAARLFIPARSSFMSRQWSL